MSEDYKNITTGGKETIPVLEEKLRLDKREAVTGRVQVRIRNETEERLLQADLRTETVDVERIPIGRELAAGEALPVPREEEDGVLVVPVLEEVLVVEKRLVLREELRLRRTSVVERVEEPVTVLRQHAEVERLPPMPGADPE